MKRGCKVDFPYADLYPWYDFDWMIKPGLEESKQLWKDYPERQCRYVDFKPIVGLWISCEVFSYRCALMYVNF